MTDTTMLGTQIGSVISLTGSVWAVSGDTQRPLTEGAPVYEGEEIITESDSNVEVKFADDTVLGQGEESAVRLDDYVFDGEDGSLDFQMIKGVMRVVSGEIVKANPEGFNLSTPLATIGIRGTEVMIQVDQGREFIGVDQLGEGHTVLIATPFNEIVIDKAGLFSGVDFDGSLIAPDEMPDSFISTIVRAAPLTILGDPPRTPGESQEVVPPQSYETLDNLTGEFQPGVGQEEAEEELEEEEGELAEAEEEFEEEFELTEEEIEALLELETAAGTEEGAGVGTGEALDSVVDVAYDPFANSTDANQGAGAEGGQDQGTGGDDEPPAEEPDDAPPPDDTVDTAPPPEPEDQTVTQASTEENEPVTVNVLEDEPDEEATLVEATLVEDTLTGEDSPEGTVTFEPTGEITYTPAEGEDGTVEIEYTVANAEGETDTATLSIDLVEDSEPTVTTTDAIGQEVGDMMIATGTISADFGADEEGSSIELNSEGASWYGGSQTLIADDASWAIELTDDGYEYTQFAPMYDAALTAPGEELTVNVEVKATDGDGSVTIGEFTVTVDDDGPTATNAEVTQVIENTTVNYNVISEGDADAGVFEGGTLISATLAEGSLAEGELTHDSDGTITYTPAAEETGTVTIDYTVQDSDGDSASAQLTIELASDSEPVITTTDVTVAESEDLPTAFGTFSVAFGADIEGSSIELESDQADWDEETQTLTAEDDSWDIVLTDGGYLFTQHESFDHEDGVDYAIDVEVLATDGDGTESHGEFTVLVTDDGPHAEDVVITQAVEDTEITYNVLTQGDVDLGVDGGSLTAASLNDASEIEGEVSFDSDGTITFDPAPDASGTALINYTVTDSDGSTATAQITVEVDAVNDAPVAVTDTIALNEDFATNIDVLTNDTDVDSTTLTIIAATSPDHGSVTVNDDHTITYTPALNYHGADSFTYTVADGAGGIDTATVNLTVNPVNDDPVAVADFVTLNEDLATTIDVLANDYDVDGDMLSVTAVTNPDHGSVTLNDDYTITYTPADNYSGTDSFTYTISDGVGGDTAPVTVNLTVNPDNDAPVAVTESVTLDEDIATTINVLANDTDAEGNTLTVTATTDPAHGSVTVNADNTVTYTPELDYSGADSFTYTITDGIGGTDTATVNLTVNPVNDAPVAVADSITLDEDIATTIDVLSNDSDLDSSTLTVTATTNPTHGSVLVNTDGTVTYTPEADYYGTDSFTYTVSDGAGGTDTAFVSLTVNPVNDAPVAVDNIVTLAEDSATTITVLDGDSDVDSTTLTVTATTDPSHGSVTVNADNTITYTPALDYSGADSFTYTISDGTSTDTATVNLTVTPVNDAPVAVDDIVTLDEDIATTIDVLSSDSDVDSSTLTITATTNPAHGSVLVNTDGTITYTPEADYYGTDSFTYTISDGTSTDTAAVSLTVNPVNDAPVAVDDTFTLDEDIATTFDVLDNDTDVDSSALTVTATSIPAHGSVFVNADNTVTYTPEAGYSGTDSFTYTVSDGEGATDTATVNLTIEPTSSEPGETLIGGPRPDVLIGTSGDDYIDGEQGSDLILGMEGDDELYGSNSPDIIFGGSGEDTIDGGHAGDFLAGGSDDDTLFGDKGADWIEGDAGDDLLVGEDGKDMLIGGSGSDTFVFTSPDDGTDQILDFNAAEDYIAMYESTFDLTSDENGNIADSEFATVDAASYTGGYLFESGSGLVYASEKGVDGGEDSNTGKLYYQDGDTITLIAEVTEDEGGGDIQAVDVEIL